MVIVAVAQDQRQVKSRSTNGPSAPVVARYINIRVQSRYNPYRKCGCSCKVDVYIKLTWMASEASDLRGQATTSEKKS